MRTRGRRRKRRRSHRVLDPTYPELSVARATLVFFKASLSYLCNFTTRALDHTYTELSVARATLVSVYVSINIFTLRPF